MATKLEGPLKREVVIGDVAHMLVIDPKGLKLTIKGRRIGQELLWEDLVSGQAALAVALNASLAEAGGRSPGKKAREKQSKRKASPFRSKK